jgi:hypothetical protein
MTFRGSDLDPPCRQPLTKASRCCALIMNGHRAAPTTQRIGMSGSCPTSGSSPQIVPNCTRVRLSVLAPSVGYANLRALSRRAASHTPIPSCMSTFMRLANR